MATLSVSSSSGALLSLMQAQQATSAQTGSVQPLPNHPSVQSRVAAAENPVRDALSKAGTAPLFRDNGNSAVLRSPLENPDAFFASRTLTRRAGDMLSIKEAIGETISTIRTTTTGVSEIGSLVEKARGLTAAAYASLGNDAASVARRRELAKEFNALKDQVDGVAKQGASSGKTLLAADGTTLAADAASRRAVDGIQGISGTEVTNLTAADRYRIRVSGTGVISGTADSVADAQRDRGLLSLGVSGRLSATTGNFDDIAISLGRTAEGGWSVTLSEGDERFSFALFNDEPAPQQPQPPAPAPVPVPNPPPGPPPPRPVVESVAVKGNISQGETYRIRVAGQEFAYTATKNDIQGQTPEERRQNVARGLQAMVTGALASRGFSVSEAEDGAFAVAKTDGAQPRLETVAMTGNLRQGEMVRVSVAGQEFTYTVTKEDMAGKTPEERQQNVARRIQAMVNEALASKGYVVGEAKDGAFGVAHPGSFKPAEPPPGGPPPDGPPPGNPPPPGNTPRGNTTIGISASFSSGVTVSLSVDRESLDALGSAAAGTSTVRKSVDIAISASSLSGGTLNRSAANEFGDARLAEGENAFAFESGTVRLNVDAGTLRRAADASAEGTVFTIEVTDPLAGPRRAVQLNETATNRLELPTVNVSTGGQGLRLDYAHNDWTDREDIDRAVAQLGHATQNLEAASTTLDVNMGIVRARQSFTTGFSDVLAEGARRLRRADMADEDPQSLFKETREQVKSTPYALSGDLQPAILNLFPQASAFGFR